MCAVIASKHFKLRGFVYLRKDRGAFPHLFTMLQEKNSSIEVSTSTNQGTKAYKQRGEHKRKIDHFPDAHRIFTTV